MDCRSQLVGEVNVYNVMAAALSALERGCSAGQIENAIEKFQRVSGRFERVAAGQPFTVIVDYAHTDDALRNLIRIARSMLKTQKSCGGDRDRTKRPLMGRAAGEGSDFVVLTSDNPRSEDPLAIIQEARVGLEQTKARFTVEPDRAKAIRIAISEAQPGDIVLIAGKGHEKYQITREGTFPFDDVEVARAALSALGFSAKEISSKGVPVA
jgi:UDP-N-acetylmuramoyl-L-alanyl-D-glutamate--2,6-diaminopimelate ligase